MFFNWEEIFDDQYFMDQGVCPACGGSGQQIDPNQFRGMTYCWSCDGTGKYQKSEQIQPKVATS